MSQPVRLNRPLNDTERSLLCYLTTRSIAEQMGWSIEKAADALDDLAERGEMHFRGDAVDAYVDVRGRILIHVTREWLGCMAVTFEEDSP